MKRAALFLLVLAGCGGSSHEDLGTMPVVHVTRDLLSDPPAWEFPRSHPEEAPFVNVICPAMTYGLDGSDRIALVMPPPAETRFEVPAGPPSVLRMRAGADITTHRLFGGDNPGGVFRFEVLVNDQPVYEHDLTIRRADDPGSEWNDVGGAEGLPVQAGDRVTLRTSAHSLIGEELTDIPVAHVGFGDLRLERRLERPRTRSEDVAPNVVLIVMDTLRADRLSTYGYERPTSPHLDRMAKRGLVFHNAYSTASWTWPSTASLLTGLQPEEHGVQGSSSSFLPRELETIAERMQQEGLTTAGWSANPLVSKSRNFAQGFETFADDPSDFRKTGTFFHEVEAWLRDIGDTRFFLYLHLTEPHRPYEALEEGRSLLAAEAATTIVEDTVDIVSRLRTGKGWGPDGTSLLEEKTTEKERADIHAIYDACVWSGDAWLGRVLDLLEELRLDDRTVVAFTSDHGEELFERNYLGHSKTVHAELVRVPLVLQGPGIPEGVVHHEPVSNRVLPAFLTCFTEAPLDPSFDTRRFLAGDLAGRPVLYSTEKGFWNGYQNASLRGLRVGDLVVHDAPGAGPWGTADTDAGGGGDVRLFDVAADPKELVDVSRDRAEDTQRLRELLRRRFRELVPRVDRAQFTAGAATELLLERIGYAGE